MAEQNGSSYFLGYSGGAAPDLHRCSLFVGPSHGKRPTTNARRNASKSSRPGRTVKSDKKKNRLRFRLLRSRKRLMTSVPSPSGRGLG